MSSSKPSDSALETLLEEKRLSAFFQFWNSACHIGLNDLSRYQCSVCGSVPSTACYGEIASGLRLRRSETLSNGRTLPGSPYSFVACQTCIMCSVPHRFTEDSYSFPWESPLSETATQSKRFRAMTSLDLCCSSDSQPNMIREREAEMNKSLPVSFSGNHSSRHSRFCTPKPAVELPTGATFPAPHQVTFRTMAKGRSLSRPRRRDSVECDCSIGTRRSSNIELLPQHPKTLTTTSLPTESSTSRRPGRQTLSLPGRTSTFKFRKAGLLFRGSLNIDSILLSDELPGGSLIVATSHLRYVVHPSSFSSSSSSSSSSGGLGIEPLITNYAWRERLTDRLILLQEVLLNEKCLPGSSLPSGSSVSHIPLSPGGYGSLPWVIEGVIINGGKLSVISCRPINLITP